MRQFSARAGASFTRRAFLTAAGTGLAGFSLAGTTRARDPKRLDNASAEEAVARGLEWLKREQRNKGEWTANGGRYRIAMTGLAGLAFLMEGSTLKEGKYTEQVGKAANWLLARQRDNGLIIDGDDVGESGHYMHGHGFATLFLASAYGEAEDGDQLKKLERAVQKAVDFTCQAQTKRVHPLAEGKSVEIGGWGYASAKDTRGYDEGSVTVTQLQALRAANEARLAVPKNVIDRSVAYLDACTTPRGGVIYSYADANGRALAGQERPPLTAAAVACSFSAGQYGSESAKKWIKFCKDNIRVAAGTVAHDEYQNYYFAQFVYVLGDDKYGKLFPTEPKADRLTWGKYRDAMVPYLLNRQDRTSGAWTGGHIGPVSPTAVNLAILQLERDLLPIFRR